MTLVVVMIFAFAWYMVEAKIMSISSRPILVLESSIEWLRMVPAIPVPGEPIFAGPLANPS